MDPTSSANEKTVKKHFFSLSQFLQIKWEFFRERDLSTFNNKAERHVDKIYKFLWIMLFSLCLMRMLIHDWMFSWRWFLTKRGRIFLRALNELKIYIWFICMLDILWWETLSVCKNFIKKHKNHIKWLLTSSDSFH